jgi:hypothetical protein
MGLDLRIPIGLLFTVFGVLLSGFGLFSNKAIYEASLGININLNWGLVLLVFGIVMLSFGMKGNKKTIAAAKANAAPPAKH